MNNTQDYSAWLKSLTLKERVALLDSGKKHRYRYGFNDNVADYRFAKLRNQTAFEKDSAFDKKMEADGVEKESLYDLFGETTESLSERLLEKPEIVSEIASVFEEWSGDSSFLEPYLELYDNKLFSCVVFTSPIVERALKNFELRVKRLGKIPFSDGKVNQLFLPILVTRLFPIIDRVLALELNVARINGDLRGDTPESRFDYFVSLLKKKENVLSISREYVGMTRRLLEVANDWVDFSTEFIIALLEDWEDISKAFNFEVDDEVDRIIQGTQDVHKRGRAVMILQLKSGRKVVHKPRSLSVDAQFYELLSDLNERGVDPPFRLLEVVDRKNHGWIEYVEYLPCESLDEVERFYKRQGAFLALMYVLEGADFHYENIIASSEHPVFVDLEALFQPKLRMKSPELPGLHLAADLVKRSVMKLGVLPNSSFGKFGEGLDVGGLTGSGSQLTPSEVSVWSDVGTDSARIVYERIRTGETKNQPMIRDKNVNFGDYLAEILEGFASMYKLILDEKDKLMTTDNGLQRFLDSSVRIILRPSQVYALLIQDSYHPDVSRDVLDRDILFDGLWLGAEDDPTLEAIISSEKVDLHRADIPIFDSEVNSTDVTDSHGKSINGLIDVSGYDRVKDLMARIGPKDLVFQQWLIESSILTRDISGEVNDKNSYLFTRDDSNFDQNDCLTEAKKIGDRIEELAIQDSEGAEWLELSLVNETDWHVLPAGVGLYSGISGVILFLAYLGLISKDDKYLDLAVKALNSTLLQTERIVSKKSELEESITTRINDPGEYIGAFTGLSGVVYLLSHLGVIWEDQSMLDRAKPLRAFIHKLVATDSSFDIIGGAAGCILTMLSLYKVTQCQDDLDVAIDCGNRLAKQMVYTSNGIKWETKNFNAGFSHGATGIGAALCALSDKCNNDRFGELGLRAIEQGFKSIGEDQEGKRNVSWCHGSAGVGSAMLVAAKSGYEIRTIEFNRCVQEVVDGFGQNHCMCHGDFGSIDFLIEATRRVPDNGIVESVEALGHGLINSFKEGNILTGVPRGIETPGLMVGLSGVGYGLLRLLAPERVPSFLMLNPPRI